MDRTETGQDCLAILQRHAGLRTAGNRANPGADDQDVSVAALGRWHRQLTADAMSQESPPVAVYQRHVWLRVISPMVWRRLLVCSDGTIAAVHRFLFCGKEFGVAHLDDITVADDPTRVRVAAFGFRPRERFTYEYDFGDRWQHVVRAERVLPVESSHRYPAFIGRAQTCPREDCDGP